MLSRLVTLHLANEPACSGEDLNFTCESATESDQLLWTITELPGVPNISSSPGATLSRSYERITSPDTMVGPNPSTIIIGSVTVADNGATLGCGVVDMELRNITLSIRK